MHKQIKHLYDKRKISIYVLTLFLAAVLLFVFADAKGPTVGAAADTSELAALVVRAKTLKESDYTTESWEASKSAIDQSIADAETVLADADSGVGEIENALTELHAAMNGLVRVGGQTDNTSGSLDKDTILIIIASALLLAIVFLILIPYIKHRRETLEWTP